MKFTDCSVFLLSVYISRYDTRFIVWFIKMFDPSELALKLKCYEMKSALPLE